MPAMVCSCQNERVAAHTYRDTRKRAATVSTMERVPGPLPEGEIITKQQKRIPHPPLPCAPRFQSQDNASIASYNNGGGGGGSYGTISTDVEVRDAGYLRATQDYLWSQTQGAGGGGQAAGRGGGGSAAAGAGARVKYVAFPSQTQSKMLGAPSAYGGSWTVKYLVDKSVGYFFLLFEAWLKRHIMKVHISW